MIMNISNALTRATFAYAYTESPMWECEVGGVTTSVHVCMKVVQMAGPLWSDISKHPWKPDNIESVCWGRGTICLGRGSQSSRVVCNEMLRRTGVSPWRIYIDVQKVCKPQSANQPPLNSGWKFTHWTQMHIKWNEKATPSVEIVRINTKPYDINSAELKLAPINVKETQTANCFEKKNWK